MDLQYDGQQVEGHCLAHGHLAVAGYSMAVGKSSPNLTDSLSSSSMKPIESCESRVNSRSASEGIQLSFISETFWQVKS